MLTKYVKRQKLHVVGKAIFDTAIKIHKRGIV